MARYGMQDTEYRIQDTSYIMHRASCTVHHVNENGVALVMVLILSAIALAIMAGLIYMITVGTQISGVQKRYKTALEAGIGGSELTYQFIGLRGETSGTNSFKNTLNNLSPSLNASITTPNTCITSTTALLPDGKACTTLGNYTGLSAKLNLPTGCWSGCDKLLTITPPDPGDPDNTSYDMRYDLGIDTQYRVYAKIGDTILGNTGIGGDEGLMKSGVVSSNTGEVIAQTVPYLYTIEVDAENADNPAERAKLSILYQY